MLTHRLDSHIRQLLLTWFFGVKGTAVTFHEPSFKVVYLKHPSLMDAICNHKDAIQNWSDDIIPICKCDLLRKYPTARAAPNLGSDHWVGGSLNNKIFPNKKNLKKLFLDAFQPGANRMLFLAHLMGGFYNISNLYGRTTTTIFLIILQLLPSDNFRNNPQNVSSIMKTNELHPFEFFAHVNIFNALTRPSVTLQFLPAPTNHLRFA